MQQLGAHSTRALCAGRCAAPRVVSRSRSGAGAKASAEATTAPSQACNDPLQGRFFLPAAEAQELMSRSGQSVQEFLFSLIKPASKQARPPISGYHVGAVALGGSGNVYVGVNVEFPNAPLNNSIHGEQFLLVNCLHSGETSMRALAVSAAPCGHCRQFYAEVKDADALQFLFGKDARPKYLADLLPERFGPADLQDEPFPLLLERQSNPVGGWGAEAQQLLAQRSGDAVFGAAAATALDEARQCYAPYTRCYSGASLITASGQVFSGGCIESAAYNPTMSPFHSAVVDAITQGLQAYSQISEVVLVERRGAPVQHAANIQLLLNSVAPAAALTVLHWE